MAFEARSLRVQLPCKSTTVIAADEYEAQADVHRYWRAIARGLGGMQIGDLKCEECSANPSEPLCENASEQLNLFAFIDERVLPILRKQLEARLREVRQAEEAVAKASAAGGR